MGCGEASEDRRGACCFCIDARGAAGDANAKFRLRLRSGEVADARRGRVMDLDERIAAKRKAKKSKKPRNKKREDATSEVDSFNQSGQLKSPPELLDQESLSSDSASGKPRAVSSLPNDDVSPAEVPKFSADEGPELKSPPETESKPGEDGGTSKPGAVPMENEVPNAERLKNGGLSQDATRAGATSSDISPAERLKFSSEKATQPRRRRTLDSNDGSAHRVKFDVGGSQTGSSAGSISSNSTRPGAYHAKSSDVSAAERLKFGSSEGQQGGYISRTAPGSIAGSSSPSRPGAYHATSTDLSAAERLKFGVSPAGQHGGTNPLAAHAQTRGPGPSSLSRPGAYQSRSTDVSAAERLKFGMTGHSGGSIPGTARVVESTDYSMAERLKFGAGTADDDAANPSRPGVYQRQTTEMSAAERLKFGSQERSGQANPGAAGIVGDEPRAAERPRWGEQSQVSLLSSPAPDARGLHEEYTGAAGRDHRNGHNPELKYDNGGNPHAPVALRSGDASHTFSVQEIVEANEMNSGHFDGNNVEHLGMLGQIRDVENRDIFRSSNDVTAEKYESMVDAKNGWRTLCVGCSCVLVIVVCSLAGALASSRGKAADAASRLPPPETIYVTSAPSSGPIISPIGPPEDFAFCYESDEEMQNSTRYSNIRASLVNSGLSSSQEFSQRESYQRKSLCWLAIGDRLQLDSSDPFLQQRYSLVTIYYHFSEPATLIEQGWLSGRSECGWLPAVECDSRTATTVQKLDLSSNFLIGALPKEMGALAHVTYLDLSNNLLEGDVTTVIRSWSGLERLSLASNSFASLPSGLGDLKALNYFSIAKNELEGPIPSAIAQSARLEFLDLSMNDFTGEIPTLLGTMSSLQALYLHKNALSGSMPESVCSLRTLSLVQLSVDCRAPGVEVICDVPDCCTVCDQYEKGGSEDKWYR